MVILRNPAKSGCLQIEQSAKQKDYIDWKYEQLKSIVFQKCFPKKVTRYDKRALKGPDESYRFYTRALFKELRSEFYPLGKKSLPSTIQNYLKSSVTLAVWYMDDGGRGANTKKGVILSIPNYNLESQYRLQIALKQNSGINTTLRNFMCLYRLMQLFTIVYHLI